MGLVYAWFHSLYKKKFRVQNLQVNCKEFGEAERRERQRQGRQMNSVHCRKSRDIEGRIVTVKQRQIRGKEKTNSEAEKDQTNDSGGNWS